MRFEREMSSFSEAKERYNAYREYERKKIIAFLKHKGLQVSQAGVMGYPCYTNGGRLKRSYDFTNWKWVSVTIGNIKILISLQAFDKDKSSKSIHILMDRIGICSYSKSTSPDHFNSMEVTSFELPLGLTDLESLYKEIMERFKSVDLSDKV